MWSGFQDISGKVWILLNLIILDAYEQIGCCQTGIMEFWNDGTVKN
jgi:hypothetical protein